MAPAADMVGGRTICTAASHRHRRRHHHHSGQVTKRSRQRRSTPRSWRTCQRRATLCVVCPVARGSVPPPRGGFRSCHPPIRGASSVRGIRRGAPALRCMAQVEPGGAQCARAARAAAPCEAWPKPSARSLPPARRARLGVRAPPSLSPHRGRRAAPRPARAHSNAALASPGDPAEARNAGASTQGRGGRKARAAEITARGRSRVPVHESRG